MGKNRMAGRIATWGTGYINGDALQPVTFWQESLHVPGIYDLELDTSVLSPKECADEIRRHLDTKPYGTAFKKLADMSGEEI